MRNERIPFIKIRAAIAPGCTFVLYAFLGLLLWMHCTPKGVGGRRKCRKADEEEEEVGRERERERERERGRQTSLKEIRAPQKRGEGFANFVMAGGQPVLQPLKNRGIFLLRVEWGATASCANTKGAKDKKKGGKEKGLPFFPFLSRRPDFVKTKRGEVRNRRSGGRRRRREGIASGARQEEGKRDSPSMGEERGLQMKGRPSGINALTPWRALKLFYSQMWGQKPYAWKDGEGKTRGKILRLRKWEEDVLRRESSLSLSRQMEWGSFLPPLGSRRAK